MHETHRALDEARLDLIRRLSEAVGVSGDEGRVRTIVRAELENAADTLETDNLGNLVAVRRSLRSAGVRVMVAAHMDEVGFVVTRVDPDGFLSVAPVGGVKAEQFLGKKVWIGPGPTPGVVGTKPIHLSNKAELTARPSFSSLRIDLGMSADTIRRGGIRPGVYGTFATPFEHTGGWLRGKALDDRLGVAILIELLRQSIPDVELLGVFTVQEEIGARGAAVATHRLAPDVGLVIDCTPARDLPGPGGVTHPDPNSRLGDGPAIYVADGRTVSDPRLVKMALETATRFGLPHQIRQPGAGGTDARAIQRSRDGIPVVSVSVPGRYAHSAIGLARVDDFLATQTLVAGLLEAIGQGLPPL